MRNSSQSHHAGRQAPYSTANREQNFYAAEQSHLFADTYEPVPGSMNDALVIRAALVDGIRRSGKSREQIADEMSVLTGTEVTVRRLNAFTAESREDYRWPAELDRAFCTVTGCLDLIRCRAELAGFRVITETEYELLSLGREYLRQRRASDNVSMLEKRLGGVDL